MRSSRAHPIYINPEDLASIGGKDGDVLIVASRRGAIEPPARTANGIQRGTVIMPFSFHEAAANILTNDALDPSGRSPSLSTAR